MSQEPSLTSDDAASALDERISALQSMYPTRQNGRPVRSIMRSSATPTSNDQFVSHLAAMARHAEPDSTFKAGLRQMLISAPFQPFLAAPGISVTPVRRMTLSLLSAALCVGFVFLNIIGGPLGNPPAAPHDTTPRLSDNSVALLTSEWHATTVDAPAALASTPVTASQSSALQASPPPRQAPAPQEVSPSTQTTTHTFTVTPIHQQAH